VKDPSTGADIVTTEKVDPFTGQKTVTKETVIAG
jgi:hypothetical protein